MGYQSPFAAIYTQGNWSQYMVILARAYCCLNLDDPIIDGDHGFNITAHEKLEWQLEFQRRLREETSQAK